MTQPPRPFTSTFFSWKELSTSILQGLFITVGTLFIYQYSVQNAYNEQFTRSMVFTTLITANVFLTLVNRSFYYSILTTMKYKNDLVLWVIGITIGITGLLIYVHPLAIFFEFERLNFAQLGISVGVGFVSVIWIELVKLKDRKLEIKE